MERYRKVKSEKVIIASDHAGFRLKEEIRKLLIKKRKKVLDLGTSFVKIIPHVYSIKNYTTIF